MEEIKVQINENVNKIQQLCKHAYEPEVVYGERTSPLSTKCGQHLIIFTFNIYSFNIF